MENILKKLNIFVLEDDPVISVHFHTRTLEDRMNYYKQEKTHRKFFA